MMVSNSRLLQDELAYLSIRKLPLVIKYVLWKVAVYNSQTKVLKCSHEDTQDRYKMYWKSEKLWSLLVHKRNHKRKLMNTVILNCHKSHRLMSDQKLFAQKADCSQHQWVNCKGIWHLRQSPSTLMPPAGTPWATEINDGQPLDSIFHALAWCYCSERILCGFSKRYKRYIMYQQE